MNCKEIIEKAKSEGGGFLRDAEAEQLCQEVFELKDVPGDILEFGAFEGYSTAVLALAAKQTGNKKVYTVEWFRGLPALTEEDLTVQDHHLKEDVKGNKGLFGKRMHELDLDNVILIEEDIFGCADRLPPPPISLGFIDVDLYSTVRYCLGLCRERVTAGGRICSHDYQWHRTPGATKAIEEFLQSYSYPHKKYISLIEMQI